MELRGEHMGGGAVIRLVELRRNVALLRREVATQVQPELRPMLDELLDRGEAAIVDCESARARARLLTPPA